MDERIPFKKEMDKLYADDYTIGRYVKERGADFLYNLALKASSYIDSKATILNSYFRVEEAIERYFGSGGLDQHDYEIRTAPKSDFTDKNALAFNIGNRIYIPREQDVRGLVGEEVYMETAKRAGVIGRALDRAILDAITAHEIADVKTKQELGVDYIADGSDEHAMSNYHSIEALRHYNPKAYVAAEVMQELRDDTLKYKTESWRGFHINAFRRAA
jgi:hypothetical protein